MEAQKKLEKIKKEALEIIKNTSNLSKLEEVRIYYFGRKGEVTLIMHNLKDFSLSERPVIGKLINEVKLAIKKALDSRSKDLKKVDVRAKNKSEWIDVTATPPSLYSYGHLHPVTRVLNEMIEIFRNLGFQVIEGPEIEKDWYCFEALNIPPDHPARDMQDSFYLDKDTLPRTHTSAAQVRYMEKHKPPIRIIVPGRVYRRESDVTHSAMFHQLEGLLVDDKVTMADLKGTLETFVHAFFGPKRKVRFRPGYFPFTEPSMEMDISCGICRGIGCRSCKFSGWLELLGSGMVHPKVLKNSGIDPQKYQGFAFGIGIDRQAMLKYNIDDIRLLYENDLRFLEQF